MKFRKLKADEIELRVGEVREKGCTLLLYKDARVDQNILDETVGPMNWVRDHKEVKGVMYCGVGIWDKDKNAWVTKWDAGTESNTESQKGEASDSFKRANVNWGIGRELYTAPHIFHFCDTLVLKEDQYGNKKYKLKNKWETFGMYVSKIDYKDDVISYLQIMDKKNIVVFEYGASEEERELDVIDSAAAKTIIDLAEKHGIKVADICKAYKVESVYALTHEQAGKVKARLMKSEAKK